MGPVLKTVQYSTSNEKWHEIFWFLLYNFWMKPDLAHIRTQDERTDAHSSNNITQVATGYQQNTLNWPKMTKSASVFLPHVWARRF